MSSEQIYTLVRYDRENYEGELLHVSLYVEDMVEYILHSKLLDEELADTSNCSSDLEESTSEGNFEFYSLLTDSALYMVQLLKF